MSDRYTSSLSEYLDHDLPRRDYDALERHLETCAECRDALAELASVKTRAASLVDPPAPTDLWAGIASRIGPAGSSSEGLPARPAVLEFPRVARSWAMPQWVAAAAAFVVVAAGALWLVQHQLPATLRPAPATASRPAPATTRTSQPVPAATEATLADFDPSRIEGEIGQLQRALERGRDKLDPKTVQILEENLRIIRKATEDARRALEQDPANRDLKDYLAGSVQKKLDLVRRAATLAGV